MIKNDIKAVRAKHMGERQNRTMQIASARAVEGDDRSIELAFSSEEPYDRWFGVEVLDHSPGAVRLERLNAGGQVQIDHSMSLKNTVGRVQSARVDKDRVGRAVIRFGNSDLAQQIMVDVRDEIIGNVSVGYIVHEMKLEKTDDENDYYTVTDWEPLEVSLVAIPADTTVGVGRDFLPPATSAVSPTQPEINPMPEKKAGENTPVEEPKTPTVEEPKTKQTPEPLEPQAPDRSAADSRIREIGAHFDMTKEAEDHISLGSDVAEFQAAVRKAKADRLQPVPSAPRIQVTIPHAGNLKAFRPELYGSRAAAEEQAYRSGQWSRAVIFGDSEAARWCHDAGVRMESRVLTGTTGGQSVVVPDELVLPIINLREEYGIARRVCRIHPMASDTATVPRRISGATAYFVGREAAPTASDPGLDNVSLTARNLAAESRVSNDYADDSAINLAEFVADEQALAFATKEDACLFNGDGSSTYGGIYGVRVKIIDGNHTVGAVDAASGHDTFAEIDHDDLISVTGTLPMIPGINPNWFISKRGNALTFDALKVAGGGNTMANLGEKPQLAYLGDDIVISQSMPTSTGDLSDVAMILYGDFRMGVILGDRRGMTMMVDPYSLSSYQQTKIIGSERFDLNCHGLGDTSEAGPIVALIGE